MKVVQYHSVVKKYLIVGKLKDDSVFQLDISVSLKKEERFNLLGFVVFVDLHADSLCGDSMEYSVESFFAIDDQYRKPTVDELYRIVESNKDACINAIVKEGGERFKESLELKEYEIKAEIRDELASVYTSNPLSN